MLEKTHAPNSSAASCRPGGQCTAAAPSHIAYNSWTKPESGSWLPSEYLQLTVPPAGLPMPAGQTQIKLRAADSVAPNAELKLILPG